MSNDIYAKDKPDDCRLCYFWEGRKKRCILGEENCYYLISIPPKEKSDCDGCFYGRHKPCIGWCTKQVLNMK